MAKGHRSQIKKERNQNKDTRPSAKLSYARISAQKAGFVLDAIRGKDVQTALGILAYRRVLRKQGNDYEENSSKSPWYGLPHREENEPYYSNLE